MSWALPILIVILVLVVIVIKLKLSLTTANQIEGYPYTKKPALFSPAERSFLGVLEQAIGEKYQIFGKVRVADIVEPQRGLDNSRRHKAFNRISAKHLRV